MTIADIPEMPLDARPRPRPDMNLFGETRRPKEPLGLVYGRLMVCTGPCGAVVDVVEAAYGARSLAEHRYLDVETYVCGDCLAAATIGEEG